MKKALPKSDYPFIIRTDFTDDNKWNEIISQIKSPAIEFKAVLDFINDKKYDGLPLEQLPQFEIDQNEQDFIFLADSITMVHKEFLIQCVDLAENFGANFRVSPFYISEVANNLFIANSGFTDFENTTDADKIYRGVQ